MKLRWSYHVAQVVLELVLVLTPQILGLQAKISVLKKSLASHHGEIPFNPSVGGEAAIISINQVSPFLSELWDESWHHSQFLFKSQGSLCHLHLGFRKEGKISRPEDAWGLSCQVQSVWAGPSCQLRQQAELSRLFLSATSAVFPAGLFISMPRASCGNLVPGRSTHSCWAGNWREPRICLCGMWFSGTCLLEGTVLQQQH